MENRGLAVHRTIVAVDVEGFGDRHRTNRNQLAVRDGLYRVMREAFRDAGIPWVDRDCEDRGDGMLILAGPEIPKSLFVAAPTSTSTRPSSPRCTPGACPRRRSRSHRSSSGRSPRPRCRTPRP